MLVKAMIPLGITLAFTMQTLAAEYRVSLVETGMRDYYCTTTIAIENLSDAPLLGINTFVELIGSSGPINTSRGAFAGPVAPGETVQATMDAPNEPCDAIETYVLVVGACQLEDGFRNRDECADAVEAVHPITGARGR